MQKEPIDTRDTVNKPEGGQSLEPEVSYTLKKPTLREQLVFGVKVFAIAGLVLLSLWLVDKAL